MWWESELAELSSSFLSDPTLDDFLSEKEIEVIKENSTRYSNLKNGLIVPKHNAKVG